MSLPRTVRVFALAAGLLLCTAAGARAQEPLATARELYAAANYDAALTTLDELAARHEASSEPGTVALYRALCLYGLGRAAEGDRAVEALVAEHPLYHPPLDDLSPRIRTTVMETRRRVLPSVLQQQYSDAKSAYDRQEYKTALAGFRHVLTTLDDPDVAAAVAQSPLADLRTLSTGFRDLAEKALAPPPVVAPAPVVVAAPVAPPPPKLYTADDTAVVAPVPIRQAIPSYTKVVTQRKTAIVQVVVNESGSVESAAMLTPLDPQYDRAVVAAAKAWQYEPAKAQGVPVRYQKRVQITLVPKP